MVLPTVEEIPGGCLYSREPMSFRRLWAFGIWERMGFCERGRKKTKPRCLNVGKKKRGALVGMNSHGRFLPLPLAVKSAPLVTLLLGLIFWHHKVHLYNIMPQRNTVRNAGSFLSVSTPAILERTSIILYGSIASRSNFYLLQWPISK